MKDKIILPDEIFLSYMEMKKLFSGANAGSGTLAFNTSFDESKILSFDDHVSMRVPFIFKAKKYSDETIKDTLFVLHAEFELVYYDLDEDGKDLLSKQKGIHTRSFILPYVRELVSNTVTRANLPTLTLPVRNILSTEPSPKNTRKK